ncbi:hypothetical protein MLD38_013646 [Melastoma candidum]|uniref:Uncharacterized protein n=1 Tax=Melastoma candidum TaxID=119954 RepID=A0ACB9R9U8_9MYRT|nr:hypothetical protein MLD38_013646 [Melastoma candidum]
MAEEEVEFAGDRNDEAPEETMEEAGDVAAGSDAAYDSDSDSDSDSESESGDRLQVEALESQLSSNPLNYDAHAQYVKLLRKMGEVQKLRQAREAMCALFPLTPTMWQEWARDEASLTTELGGDARIEGLYEQAVKDYLSIPLWLDYINFVQEKCPSVRECSPDGLSKARNLFESALTASGLHITEGNKIWEAYREFEQAVYYTIDDADPDAKEKQLQRIRGLFHRQLSVPLSKLEDALLAYKSWEAEQRADVDAESFDVGSSFPHVVLAYQKALELYNSRADYEQQISKDDLSDVDKLQQYLVYLKFEESLGDPIRIQVLYERAIAEFPVSSDLWFGYTRFMDKTLKIGDVVKDVHLRATKNCPWLGELWVGYMLCLERSRASETEISAVFEKSLQFTFSTLEEYLDLFLTRVDGLRRKIAITAESEVPSCYLSIKETFQRASDYLSPHLKDTAALMHLHAYWARLETKLGNDIAAARAVWESFLKTSGSMLEAWRGYITMEIELGNIGNARSIFKRCYSKRFPGVGSEDICNSWLRFEREYGTLEEFDLALQKVRPRLKELELFALQQGPSEADKLENAAKKSAREKRKSNADVNSENPPAKRQKEIPKSSSKGKHKNTTDKVVNSDDVPAKKPEDGGGTKEPELKDSSDKKSKTFTDQCTAFVSNIDIKANQGHLQEFFSDVGGVTAIRILRDKFTGKSRGLAYVDFVDDKYLEAAVAKNRQMLFGKRLSIARSDPKKGRKESAGRSTNAEAGGAGDQSNTNNGEPSSAIPGNSPRDSKGKGPGISRFAPSRSKEQVQLKGRNTFAMPRSVKPLGWSATAPRDDAPRDEKPKSNDEFRQMLFKK